MTSPTDKPQQFICERVGYVCHRPGCTYMDDRECKNDVLPPLEVRRLDTHSAIEALKGYPRDNALEAAKDEKVLALVWRAAFGNERLDAPDMALVAHSFLAIASELEWREQCIAESANSTTLGQPWSAMSSAERAAFNQGYAQAENDAKRSHGAAWIEEELKDGDRICEAAGVRRTEGGRLPVAKITNALRANERRRLGEGMADVPLDRQPQAIRQLLKAEDGARANELPHRSVSPGTAAGGYAAAPSSTRRSDYLLNGVRFKLSFNKRGGTDVFWNHAKELEGRWVALVAAEDDRHIAPEPGIPSTLPRDTLEQYKAFAAKLRAGEMFAEPLCWPTVSEHFHMAADTIDALVAAAPSANAPITDAARKALRRYIWQAQNPKAPIAAAASLDAAMVELRDAFIAAGEPDYNATTESGGTNAG